MNQFRFGTDGIRGSAEQLQPIARHVGMAVALRFPGTVFIGGDPRESSELLIERTEQGLCDAGADVIDVGTIPTPGLAYLSARHRAQAGVIITASHNAWTDNGIKVFGSGGSKLSDAQQTSLEAYIADDYLTHKAGGTIRDGSLFRQEYRDFLVDSADGERFDGLRIAIDCANGAASEFAPAVFEQLGATVTPMFVEPDGRNINEGCGATNTRALEQRVVDENLDMGIALDGDADRVMIVDRAGNVMNGDHILYILATTGGLDTVIATQMSNIGLEKALAERGISLHRTDVGDRYVLAGIEETGAKLGGEQSGHIIIPERLATGDGMLAAIQVIKAVRKSGKTLEEWRAELDGFILPQKIVNIPLADKTRLTEPSTEEFIARETDRLGSKGRVNIRPSGTEPLARIMVEAPDADSKAHDIAERLTKHTQELGNLRLARGRNYALEDQLIVKTRQPHISGAGTGTTPKDLTKRFGDREMLDVWANKGRDITWLVEPTSDPNNPELAGILWTGEEEFPFAGAGEPPKLTLAIRLYEGYTGKKLSAPFIRHGLLALAGQYRGRGESLPGIWLQTNDDNDYARRTYERLGFTVVDSRDGRTTMVL